MNKGLALYLALSTLSGTLMALQWYWGAFFFGVLLLSLFLRKEKTTVLFLSLLFILLSFLNAIIQEKNHQTSLSYNDISSEKFTITINDIPSIDGNTFVSRGKIKKEDIMLRYLIPTKEDKKLLKGLKPGATCRVKGEFSQPNENRNPNMFNYKQYLYQQQIFFILSIKTIEECTIHHSLKYSLMQWRFDGLRHIENTFPLSTIGVTQALIFGESERIPEEVMNTFRELGVVHLLAISGLHVGLVFFMLYFVLLRIGMIRENVNNVLLLFLFIYTMITGGAPPVIRASSMCMIIIVSRRWSKSLTTLDSLSIIFSLYLFYNPFSVFNVGFQLSFVVSLSIILSSENIISSSYVIQLFKVTAVAQASSLPIMMYHFYEFSIIGFFTNLIYVPLFSIVILPITLFLFFMSFLSSKVTEWGMILYEYLVKGVGWWSSLLSDLPMNTVVIGKPSIVIAIFYAAVMIVFFIGIERRKGKYAFILYFTVLTGNILWNNYQPFGEIIFIDVGQGDSILIKQPFNRGTYLIDTGGEMSFPKEEWEIKQHSFSVGEDILVPFLKSKGVTTLDKLILTHSDLDHIGGAQDLLNQLNIKEVYISPNSWQKEGMNQVVKAAYEKNLPVKEVKYPHVWHEQNNQFYIISPHDDKYEGNNDSIVLYAEIGQLKWMFTGDLEAKGEEIIREFFDFEVDVLKVGHHGSKTSTTEEFLSELNPSVAIISAGENNRFNHPHPEVIDRLKRHGIKVLNTGENGAVTYRFWYKEGTFSAQFP